MIHGNLPYISYRHIEPEHLSPNFVQAVRYSEIIYRTKVLSMPFPMPTNSYNEDTNHGIRRICVPRERERVPEADHRYKLEPPVPRPIDIMREYYDFIPMPLFY